MLLKTHLSPIIFIPKTSINFIHNFVGAEHQQNGSSFAGQVSDVRIWDTVRSTQEIRLEMKTPSIDIDSKLIGYYQCSVESSHFYSYGVSHAIASHL